MKRATHTIPQWQIFGKVESQPSMDPTSEYFMEMYPLLRTPWFAIVLRKIFTHNGEGEPLHSHGFCFTTMILKGKYLEERPNNKWRWLGFGSVNRFEHDTVHAIRDMKNGPVWTIGLHKKWKGFRPPHLLVDGEMVYVWDYKPFEKFRGEDVIT